MKMVTVIFLCFFLISCGGNNPPKINSSDTSSVKVMSDFEREIYLKQEMALAEDMWKYGYSYHNKYERERFRELRRKRGIIKLRERMIEAEKENRRLKALYN